MEHFGLMVHLMQDMADLKFAAMATGELCVMTSGTIEMQVLYVESLDSHHMVCLRYVLLVIYDFHVANCCTT